MTNIGDTSATTSLMAFLHFLGIQTSTGFLHSLGAIVLRQSQRRDSEASQDTGSKQQGYMTLTISASLHRKTRRMRISAGGWLKD